MLHTAVHCCCPFFFFVPARIVIPGNNIQHILKFFIIQSVVVVHKIGSYREVRTTVTDSLNLCFQEINCAVCYKSFPVKVQCLQCHLPPRGRTFDLVKTVIPVAPECSAPAVIQIVDGAVFFLKPLLKFRLAERAVTFPAVLIGNMPQDHARMFSESQGQLFVDTVKLLSVNRRCITVIVSCTKKISYPVPINS